MTGTDYRRVKAKQIDTTSKLKGTAAFVWAVIKELENPSFSSDDVFGKLGDTDVIRAALDTLCGRGILQKEDDQRFVRVSWWDYEGTIHKVLGDEPPSPEGKTKVCKNCGITKGEEGFYWSHKRPGHLTTWCRDCLESY